MKRSIRIPGGKVIEKVENIRSWPNAESILEGEEFNWDWFLAEVDLSKSPAKGDWNDAEVMLPEENYDWDSLRSWAESLGGIYKALRHSPILIGARMGLSGPSWWTFDGFHRMIMAKRAGLKMVTILIGGPKDRRP